MSKSYFPAYVLYQGEKYPTLVRTVKDIKSGISFRLLKTAEVEDFGAFKGILVSILLSLLFVGLYIFIISCLIG